MSDLADAVLAGDRRAVARLLTLVENSPAAARPFLAALYQRTGRAHIIGITGAPGSGKSTLVNRVAIELRRRSRTVGVIAVDPSSPFSGGAILGDRIRMQDTAADPGVFIRSMATRGSLGGLSRAAADAIRVLDAAGRDVVLVETVGVGQDEVDVARSAHTTIVLQMPTLGDDIQTMKAGILEIADILVVNKADQPGAQRVQAALEMMLELGVPNAAWRPPVLQTIATQGQGVAELVDAVERHLAYLEQSDQRVLRERQRVHADLLGLLREDLAARAIEALPAGRLDDIVQRVVRRELDPYGAAAEIIAASAGQLSSAIDSAIAGEIHGAIDSPIDRPGGLS